jgi:hypothetical protein
MEGLERELIRENLILKMEGKPATTAQEREAARVDLRGDRAEVRRR